MENSKAYYRRTFSQNFHFEPQELLDGMLLTEDGQVFNIHKMELSKHSNYFYRLFCGIGKGKNEFLIPGIRGDILGSILSYIYSGNIEINKTNICDILLAADYLLLDGLLRYIEETCLRDNLSIDNCIPLLTAAFNINQKNILKESFRFLQTQFETVIRNEDSEFGKLPLKTLKQMLCDKSLCVRDENVVWMAIIKWVLTDFPHRQSQVPDLLMCLNVSNIDEELASRILYHAIITNNPYCERINEIQVSHSFDSNLSILTYYVQTRSNVDVSLINPRQTQNLYFIAHYCIHNQTHGVHIYVTYDSNIDLWRKIFEIDVSPEFLIAIGHNIYMLSSSENRNFCFNVIEKKWNEIANFTSLRQCYEVVELRGLIYVLGGISVLTEEIIDDVEVYDPVSDLWFIAASMPSVTSFNTAVFRNKIYIVGNTPNVMGSEMITQSYDQGLDAWNDLPPPAIFRFNFAFVEHRDKLYVIGGRNEEECLKSVEVFDPVKEEWTTFENLPHQFYLPKAVVLNDQLIVYDNHLEDRSYRVTNPAVIWDEMLSCWKLFEESSPMNMLHKYHFFTPDDKESVNRIAWENKDPRTEFVWSPFK